MTLQRKFLLLISMLALAIVASGAGAFWSFRVLLNELYEPFQSTVGVLDILANIKRNVESQGLILAGVPRPRSAESSGSAPEEAGAEPGENAPLQSEGAGEVGGAEEAAGDVAPLGFRAALFRGDPAGNVSIGPDEIATFRESANSTLRLAQRLEAQNWYRRQVGATTWRSIKDKIFRLHAVSESFFAAPEKSQAEGDRLTAAAECYRIHELIEKSEQRILTDAGLALRHAENVEWRLVAWLSSVFALGALFSILAVILLRRWVHRPVAALREAAARIAAGDFTHRVAVAGHDELARLSGEVNHMAQMVHEMQEERVERERLAAIGGMVRRLVHNVRNPLSGIRGLAEVTRLDAPKGSEARENLDLIVSTVDRFERWLTELLATTSPMHIHIRSCGVKAWLSDVVEIHRPMAQTKGVELVVDTERSPIAADFDPSHMDHALAAILSNAIEATPRKGKVWIHVQLTPDEKLELRVTDQGPGISKELMTKVFEPHFTTKQHGTGMGLALAQQVVRAHQGRITVGNALGEEAGQTGASFSIRLPVKSTANESTLLVENSH